MRTAINGLKLVQRVKQETGLEIEIINGKDEAALILDNHIERTLKPKRHYVYIDVGGDSTELTLIYDKQVLATRSFPIGSERLLEEKVIEKKPKVIIVGNVFHSNVIELIKEARKLNIKIISIFDDWHFDKQFKNNFIYNLEIAINSDFRKID